MVGGLATSGSTLVAIELHVQTRTVAESSSFADLADPVSAGMEGLDVDALGHEEDVGGLPAAKFGQQFFDFVQIIFGRDNKFELKIWRVIDELLDHRNIDPILFMRFGESTAFSFPWSGIRELGGEAGQIELDWLVNRGRGFDGYVTVFFFEGGGQIDDVGHDHRFAAGEDDVLGAVLAPGVYDLLHAHIAPLGFPTGVIGIAPGAAEVAAAGSDEKGGEAGQLAFALDGIEEFGDFHLKPMLSRLFARRMGPTTREVKSSHVPFVSKPAAVVGIIEEAAQAPAQRAAAMQA